MAEGNGAGHDSRFQQQLDDCLDRMRRGDSLERCLAEYPDAADELRPLLAMAARLVDETVPAPLPASGLTRSRQKFLSALQTNLGGAKLGEVNLGEVNLDSADARSPEAIEPTALGSFGEVLDAAIAAVVAGTDPEDVLRERPEVAHLVRPLVQTANQLRRSTQAPPAPPKNLAPGRARFLGLAAAVRNNMAMADAPVESESELLAVAEQLRADVRDVPPAPHGLVPARARFLERAGALRTAAESARPRVHAGADDSRTVSWESGLAGLVGALRGGWASAVESLVSVAPMGGGPTLRLVTTALIVVLVLVLGNVAVLAPASAESLPGDTLYPIKRLNEQIALSLTLNTERRDALQASFDARRIEELETAQQLGRPVKLEVSGVLLKAWHVNDDDDRDETVGRLSLLSRPSAEEPVTTTVAWGKQTEFDLGEYANPVEVPIGSELRLVARTRGESALPLAERVELMSTAVPSPTPTQRLVVTRVPATGTAQPVETLSPTETPTPTASPTQPTDTPSPIPTASPTPTAGDVSQPIEPKDRLDGILESDPAASSWNVRRWGTGDSVEARVDEVEVPATLASGHRVLLEGRWQDGVFHADFLARHGPANCERLEAQGIVAEFDGQSLTFDNGWAFVASPEAAVQVDGGTVRPGEEVRVVYRDCGVGVRYMVSITVVPDEGETVQGRIVSVGDNEVTLTEVTNRPRGTELRVTFDTSTAIEPEDGLAVGAIVEVTGRQEGDAFVARRIRVLRAPTPTASPEQGTEAEPGVGTPTPAATVGHAPTEPAQILPPSSAQASLTGPTTERLVNRRVRQDARPTL